MLSNAMHNFHVNKLPWFIMDFLECMHSTDRVQNPGEIALRKWLTIVLSVDITCNELNILPGSMTILPKPVSVSLLNQHPAPLLTKVIFY